MAFLAKYGTIKRQHIIKGVVLVSTVFQDEPTKQTSQASRQEKTRKDKQQSRKINLCNAKVRNLQTELEEYQQKLEKAKVSSKNPSFTLLYWVTFSLGIISAGLLAVVRKTGYDASFELTLMLFSLIFVILAVIFAYIRTDAEQKVEQYGSKMVEISRDLRAAKAELSRLITENKG